MRRREDNSEVTAEISRANIAPDSLSQPTTESNHLDIEDLSGYACSLIRSKKSRRNKLSATIVYINDKRVDFKKATVSVFDYTLHCGIGLFESILAIDDRLILLDEHLDRMESGLSRLGLDNLRYNRNKIKKTMTKAVSSHRSHIKKSKLFLTQGYSPMWPGSKPNPKTIIIVTAHNLEFRSQKLLISPMTISTDNPLRGAKTLNYLTEWMSQTKAVAAGYDQGIIINQRGHVAETGSANIFIVKNGRLYTPPLESGGLPGITRSEIMRLARANKISCREKKLTPADLVSADEVFTSSSFKIIWPVTRIKLDRVHRFKPGELSRAFYNRMTANFLSGHSDDRL